MCVPAAISGQAFAGFLSHVPFLLQFAAEEMRFGESGFVSTLSGGMFSHICWF